MNNIPTMNQIINLLNLLGSWKGDLKNIKENSPSKILIVEGLEIFHQEYLRVSLNHYFLKFRL